MLRPIVSVATRRFTITARAPLSLATTTRRKTPISESSCNDFHTVLTVPRQRIHTSSACQQQKKDYYQILGVARNAAAKDIKKAYYQLAKKYHPDTNKADTSCAKQFQEVSEAYEVCIYLILYNSMGSYLSYEWHAEYVFLS